MRITTELAQPIVQQIMQATDYNINIMNREGVIVASSDPVRINQVHQGALEVIRLGREKVIEVDAAKELPGTKPGVNLPLEFDKEIVGTVGVTGDPAEVYPVARIVKVTVEALLQQRYLSDQLRYRQKAVEDWVFDLINPNYKDEGELEKRSHFLKIDVNIPSVLLIVDIENMKHGHSFSWSTYEEERKKEARVLQIFSAYGWTPQFTVYLEKGRFILALPAAKNESPETWKATAENLQEKLAEEGFAGWIGISYENRGVKGYRMSYREAVQSLELLYALKPQKRVAHIADWGFIWLLANVPLEIRGTYLRRVLQNKPPLDSELKATLETFLACEQNVGLTAEKLHIHRNTLLYRLDKIKQLWGLDPRRFSDAVTLLLLLLCCALEPGDGPNDGRKP
ncbi:sugar diacid recognition domain-containing protein [Bacillaceae bacterium]